MYEHSGLSAAWERCGFSSVTAVTMGTGSSQVEFPAWVTCSPPTALSSPLPPWLSASLGLEWSVAVSSASSLTFCPLHLSGMGELRSQKTLFCCLLDIGKPAAGVLPFRLISVCCCPLLLRNSARKCCSASDTGLSLPVRIPLPQGKAG